MADEMIDDAPDSTPEDVQQPETGQGNTGDGKSPEHKAILADLAKERRERKRLTAEIDELRKASLSDQERAVAEAKQQGHAEGSRNAGMRLARAEIRAQGAAKGLDVAALLEDVDLSRFIGDDGEPDEKAIGKAIDRWSNLTGNAATRQRDIGQGYRPQNAPVNDMNVMIRRLAGHQ